MAEAGRVGTASYIYDSHDTLMDSVWNRWDTFHRKLEENAAQYDVQVSSATQTLLDQKSLGTDYIFQPPINDERRNTYGNGMYDPRIKKLFIKALDEVYTFTLHRLWSSHDRPWLSEKLYELMCSLFKKFFWLAQDVYERLTYDRHGLNIMNGLFERDMIHSRTTDDEAASLDLNYAVTLIYIALREAQRVIRSPEVDEMVQMTEELYSVAEAGPNWENDWPLVTDREYMFQEARLLNVENYPENFYTQRFRGSLIIFTHRIHHFREIFIGVWGRTPHIPKTAIQLLRILFAKYFYMLQDIYRSLRYGYEGLDVMNGIIRMQLLIDGYHPPIEDLQDSLHGFAKEFQFDILQPCYLILRTKGTDRQTVEIERMLNITTTLMRISDEHWPSRREPQKFGEFPGYIDPRPDDVLSKEQLKKRPKTMKWKRPFMDTDDEERDGFSETGIGYSPFYSRRGSSTYSSMSSQNSFAMQHQSDAQWPQQHHPKRQRSQRKRTRSSTDVMEQRGSPGSQMNSPNTYNDSDEDDWNAYGPVGYSMEGMPDERHTNGVQSQRTKSSPDVMEQMSRSPRMPRKQRRVQSFGGAR